MPSLLNYPGMVSKTIESSKHLICSHSLRQYMIPKITVSPDSD